MCLCGCGAEVRKEWVKGHHNRAPGTYQPPKKKWYEVEKLCQCGVFFIPKSQNMRYCSRDCQNDFKPIPPSHQITRTGDRAKHVESYGITMTDWNRMVEEQDGCCKICGGPPKEGSVLHIDHDHVTGQVRALLCRACNTALGYMKDSIERLEAAVEYLKSFRATKRSSECTTELKEFILEE